MSNKTNENDSNIDFQGLKPLDRLGEMTRTPQSVETMEEGPQMRSVAMMSSGAMLPDPSPMFSGGQRFVKPSFEYMKPPPMGFPRPLSGGLKLTRSSGADHFGMKKEWTAAVPASVWNVDGNDLELVPLDFPLERTNREINESACKVATRISDTLRLLSIEAEYDNAKARVKCKTSDMVKFRIRLYAGNETGQPVVVEVQRRSGSASCFMRSCRAVLDAAEGKRVDEFSPQTKMPPFMKKPIREMKCLSGALSTEQDAVSTSLSSLENVCSMLRSNKPDVSILGLENLGFMVDATKSHPAAALAVSKCVVLGDETFDIREDIRVLTERDAYTPGFDDEEGPNDHKDQVRYIALSILNKALTLCAKDGCLKGVTINQNWFSDYLIPLLVNEIKRANNSANSAYQATSCVQSLIVASPPSRRLLIEEGVYEALKNAYEFGKNHHDLLCEETTRCLEQLDEPRKMKNEAALTA